MNRPITGLLLVCACSIPDTTDRTQATQERQLAASSLHHAPAWELTAPVSAPRIFPRLTELGDGRALVSGGGDGPMGTVTSEIFDPRINGYVPVAPAPTPLANHLAVRLPNGKVLVAGGIGEGAFNFPFHPDAGHLNVSKRSYLYDPATDSWTPTGDLPFATQWLTPSRPAVLLRDGRVMVCGGGRADDAYYAVSDYSFDQYPATRKTYVWDPSKTATVDGVVVQGRWSEAGLMAESHRFVDVFPQGFELEADPHTVVAGPIPSTIGVVVGGHRVFSAGTEGHTLVMLQDGRVLKIGGRAYFPGHHLSASTMEIFNPKTLAWTSVASLPSSLAMTLSDEDYGDGSRAWLAATLLGDGRVLIAGGHTATETFEPPSPAYPNGRFITTTEHARRSSVIYDPSSDSYQQGPGLDMVMGRGGLDLMQLADGSVLAIGGSRLRNELGPIFTEPTVERFDPQTLTWSRLVGADMPTQNVSSEHYGLTNASGPVDVGITFDDVPASAVVGNGQYLLVSGWDYKDVKTTDISLLFSP